MSLADAIQEAAALEAEAAQLRRELTAHPAVRWLRQNKVAAISPLGEAVAALWHDALGQLYRLDGAERRVDWGNPYVIVIKWGFRDLSTFDGGILTRLVFLAHDRAIRVEVQPSSHRYVTLLFHQRGREGGQSHRHPTLEEAVAAHRARFPREEVSS